MEQKSSPMSTLRSQSSSSNSTPRSENDELPSSDSNELGPNNAVDESIISSSNMMQISKAVSRLSGINKFSKNPKKKTVFNKSLKAKAPSVSRSAVGRKNSMAIGRKKS